MGKSTFSIAIYIIAISTLFGQNSEVTGKWEGEWYNPQGYLFEYVLELKNGRGNLNGEFTWKLIRSPHSYEQSKLGLAATEFVNGNFDSQKQELNLRGTHKNDPQNIIGLDVYKLILSEDGKSLEGITADYGTWKGVFYGIRQTENDDSNFKIKFYAYPRGTKIIKPDGTTHTSQSGHIYVGFFKDSVLEIVKGFGPDGQSFWKFSGLSEENHLVRFAKREFVITVSKFEYYRAINLRKDGYFLGVNDCVSYSVDVADAINLKTPVISDVVLTPIGFLEYLIQNN
jgi:hypothetical protein